MVSARRIGLGLLLAATFVGCRGGGPAPAKQLNKEPAVAVQEKANAAAEEESIVDASKPPSPKIENDSFVLTLTSTDRAKVGDSGALSVALEGRGAWHVNQEYPIRLEFKAPDGLGVAKTKLERSDATHFDDDAAKFELGITPKAAGRHEVTCEASFAMCTDETCVLEKRTLALNVQVE